MTVLYYTIDYKENNVVIKVKADQAMENIVPYNTLAAQVDFKPDQFSSYEFYEGYYSS